MPRITLDIAPEDFAFLKELSERNGFAGPRDCLHSLVKWALEQWRDEIEGRSANDENRKRLESIISEQALKISVLSGLLLDAIEAKAKQALEYEEKLKGRWLDVTTPTLRPRERRDLDDDIPF